MEKQEILERGRKIKAALEQQGGYWAFAPDQAMQIGPEPFVLTLEQIVAAGEHGQTVSRFWQEVLQVQLASIRGDLPAWIEQSIEGPLTQVQRDWQRKVCLWRNRALPQLARLDCTSLWFPVEVQERLGFLGGCTSWHMANDQAGYPNGLDPVAGGDIPRQLAVAFTILAGKSDPRVLLISPVGYLSEQEFLKTQLEIHGVFAAVADRDEFLQGVDLSFSQGKVMFKGQRIDVIYRRELNSATLAQTEAGLKVLQAYLDGQVAVEPPLNMLYDCKSPMAWVHHPETSGYFSQAVKDLIPSTALLPLDNDQVFRLGADSLTTNKILRELSNEKRSFVVKYAGPSIEYGLGGRAVFSLEGSHKQAGGIVDNARDQIGQGHSWIIQPQNHVKYQTWRLEGDEVVQEQMYARLLFYYIRGILFAGQANFNKNWKVAGNKTTVMSIICRKE